MKFYFALSFATLVLSGMALGPDLSAGPAACPDRPKVIVMTDGEVDDRCSMVHFLLSTNDVEAVAIIECNSCFQRNGWSSIHWLEREIDAYGKVYPNLLVHDSRYPSPDYLRSICFVGDEDASHIPASYQGSMTRPGADPLVDPASWPDTPGSERILSLLLENDSDPLYICAWGGSDTAAKAFQKLRDLYPERYERALSRVTMYNIWYQDGGGSYIERNFPMVTMLLSNHFSGTWDYDSQRYMDSFIHTYMRGDYGPLAEHYVQDVCSEGDSPSFFYLMGNGLRSYESPTYGGWGGQFHQHSLYPNVYIDNDKGSFLRWAEYVNNDFEARLRWCVADAYEKANHRPRTKLLCEREITVRSGETVMLSASVEDTDGPDAEAVWRSNMGMVLRESRGIKSVEELKMKMDGELKDMARFATMLRSSWWQYLEAGSYKGYVELKGWGSSMTFTAPEVSAPETIHMIFEASDRGTPPLRSFERVVITVVP